MNFIFNNSFYMDWAVENQLLFQDPATPMMNGIVDLHHYVMFFLILVCIFVGIVLYSVYDLFILQYNPYSLLNQVNTGFEKSFFNTIKKEEDRNFINAIYWNSLWTKIASTNEAVYSKQFNIDNNNLSFIISTDSSKYSDKEFTIILVENSENNVLESTIIDNLSTDSSFITSLYLKSQGWTKTLPKNLLETSIKTLTENLGGNKLTLKSSKEAIAVFNTYHLNLYYWLHIYLNTRSGLYRFAHNTFIEVVWTLIPTLILICIGVPSFILLYAMDEIIEPDFVIKCIGHQWYWSYEIEYPEFIGVKSDNNLGILTIADSDNFKTLFFYNTFKDVYSTNSLSDLKWGYINFDSNLKVESELTVGTPRLLEVDNALIIPAKTHIDLLVTANDVLHCWTVPSFGLKLDAVPGRLNHANLFVEREGVFYGQCSEICGVNHGFMPIKVVAVNLKDFFKYVGTAN